MALSALPQPTKYSLETLRNWLEGQGKHFGNLSLKGEDSKSWGSSLMPHDQALDLVVIKREVSTDIFSRWIVEHLIVWYQHFFCRTRGSNPEDLESGSMAMYDDEVVLRYTSHATTMSRPHCR